MKSNHFALLFAAFMLLSSCDFNALGGSKSKLDPTFEPGKHTPSEPPTIASVADYIIDENDVQTINFTIGDVDSFMMCSFVNVKTASSNNTIIDGTGLTVGGTYPNCTLKIAPKAYQYGVVNITLSAYDYWSYVSTSFQLTVVHILTPGAFSIIDGVGGDRSVEVSWQNAAYMQSTGAFTSPFYTIFYRDAYTSNPWNSIARVTSPYTVTGLTNGNEYEFYILAKNSIGTRASNTVRAFATKYKFISSEFVPSSEQYVNTAASGTVLHYANSSMLANVSLEDSNYPVFNYTAAENPVNGNFAAGTPKPSALTSPSGNYHVFVGSQGNLLSGSEQ